MFIKKKAKFGGGKSTFSKGSKKKLVKGGKVGSSLPIK